MKAIVIGASLSGKTTLVKELRKILNIPISEIDEELTKLNNNQYPTDNISKNSSLVPQIIQGLKTKKDILFFTNTDYFTLDQLRQFKDLGFKFLQIDVSYDELLRRNSTRLENEGYEDMSNWLKGMVEYQKELQKERLVDFIINGEQPTDQLVKEIRSKIDI